MDALAQEARPEGVTYVYRGMGEEVVSTDWRCIWEAMIELRAAAATLYAEGALDGAAFAEALLTKHGEDAHEVWNHQYKGFDIFTTPMPVVYAKKPT